MTGLGGIEFINRNRAKNGFHQSAELKMFLKSEILSFFRDAKSNAHPSQCRVVETFEHGFHLISRWDSRWLHTAAHTQPVIDWARATQVNEKFLTGSEVRTKPERPPENTHLGSTLRYRGRNINPIIHPFRPSVCPPSRSLSPRVSPVGSLARVRLGTTEVATCCHDRLRLDVDDDWYSHLTEVRSCQTIAASV